MNLTSASSIVSCWRACALRRALTYPSLSISMESSFTSGCPPDVPKVTSRKKSHCYKILTAASHPMMGVTLCLWRRAAVSANVVEVLQSKSVSHLLATSVALELSSREIANSNRLGKRNMMTAPPTPS